MNEREERVGAMKRKIQSDDTRQARKQAMFQQFQNAEALRYFVATPETATRRKTISIISSFSLREVVAPLLSRVFKTFKNCFSQQDRENLLHFDFFFFFFLEKVFI